MQTVLKENVSMIIWGPGRTKGVEESREKGHIGRRAKF